MRADDGTSQDGLVSRIDDVLPNGVEAVSGSSVSTENADDINELFLDMLTTFLTALAGIALLVATFSIHNTFSIIVAQRTRQAALLRALGASRGQVLRSITVEALFIGVLASLGGIAAGMGLASGLLALMDSMGMSLPASSLVLEVGTVVTAVVVGVVVTLVAIASAAFGLLASALVRTPEQTAPILVLGVMAQLVLSGGLFAVTGPVLLVASVIAPVRWGLAATAATTHAWPAPLPDPLWTSTPGSWWRACLVLVAQTVLALAATRLALRRLERPGKPA